MKTGMELFFYRVVMVYVFYEGHVRLSGHVHAGSGVTDVPYMMINTPYIHLMDCEGSTPFHQPEKL